MLEYSVKRVFECEVYKVYKCIEKVFKDTFKYLPKHSSSIFF